IRLLVARGTPHSLRPVGSDRHEPRRHSRLLGSGGRHGAAGASHRDRSGGGIAGADSCTDCAGRSGHAFHGGNGGQSLCTAGLYRRCNGGAARGAPPGGGGGMSRVLPYPLLTAALTLMWLILTSFSPSQLLLGIRSEERRVGKGAICGRVRA